MSIEQVRAFSLELANDQDLRKRLLAMSDHDFARAAVELGRSKGLAFSVEEFESQLMPPEKELTPKQLDGVVGGMSAIGGTSGIQMPGRAAVFADGAGNFIGCFVASTRVLLADGTTRPVADLEPGRDSLRIADGTCARTELELSTAGPETLPIVDILTGTGDCLAVTQHHPMVLAPTKRIVAAKRLRAGDVLFVAGKDGRFLTSPIVRIGRYKYNGLVYNYQVGRSHTTDKHLVVANGVLTGDLWLQRFVERLEKELACTRDAEASLRAQTLNLIHERPESAGSCQYWQSHSSR